jgi:large subunit ribosomal protein L13Ae
MVKGVVVVDGKGHLKGRLASYVAKELMNGQRVTVIRCEQVQVSGSLFRNKLKYMEFMHLTMSTKPSRGIQHHRAPSRVMWRCIRGMLPHKSKRGAAALGRLKCFDGCPLSWNAKKKMVVPDALKVVRLKPRARFCNIGDVVTQCGWNNSELLRGLEVQRAGRNSAWHKTKTQRCKDRSAKLKNNEELKKVNKELEAYGYYNNY